MLQVKKKHEKTLGSIFIPGKYPGENIPREIYVLRVFLWHEDDIQPEIHVPPLPPGLMNHTSYASLCNIELNIANITLCFVMSLD